MSKISSKSLRAGRRLCTLAAFVAVVSVGLGCRPRISSKPGAFAMRYFYDAPTCYHRVQIDSTTLSYTYYVAPDTLVWVMQAPCYADPDLKTVTATLSRQEIKKLADVVNRSGFLLLPDTCGGNPGRRMTGGPYVLSAGRCCDEKRVVYRPIDVPAPEPFMEVCSALVALVQRKLGHSIEVPHTSSTPPVHMRDTTRPKLRPR
jgi:hypothetical protein